MSLARKQRGFYLKIGMPRAKKVLAVLALLAGACQSARSENAASAPGLLATYSGRVRRIQLIVPSPDFYLDPGESVHPSIGTEFDAEWSGLISIRESAKLPAAYSLSHYYYLYHAIYGLPKTGVTPAAVTGVSISSDGLRVRLTLDKLVPGRVYELHPARIRSAGGDPLVTKIAAYTLNRLKK
jgi:hypothetical protein